MLATEVYQTLEDLTNGKQLEISAQDAQFLKEKGLVDFMDGYQHRQIKENLSRLSSVDKEITGLTKASQELKEAIRKGQKKKKSYLHRIFSLDSTLQKEGIDLSNLESRLETTEKKVGEAKAKKEKIINLGQEIDNFASTQGGYIRPNETTRKRMEQLAARLNRLEGITYDAFEEGLRKIREDVDKRFDKYIGLYNHLVDQGFEKGNTQVFEFALALSAIDDSFENIYTRMGVINSYLWDNEWKSYDRLRVVSLVATQEGNIHKLKDSFKNMFLTVVNKGGHKKCYDTWAEAATAIKIPGKKVQDKFQRYDKVLNELSERGWKKSSAAACYIAANLAYMDGDEEELAEMHRDQEIALIERGRTDCVESGIAALILMEGEGSVDEKADQFNKIFLTMHEYGWDKHTQYYAAAATLALMPGSIKENVELLYNTKEMLKERGQITNLTNRALPLITGNFRDIYKR